MQGRINQNELTSWSSRLFIRPREILGMIVHGHMEHIEQDQARAAVDLQEPPEPLCDIRASDRARATLVISRTKSPMPLSK